ncbi:MAG: rRNA pseudouridine synthase [Candidatus Latescibacteria bacterium]|nr:rRNA pseudouridine synthase [Candidatus Latescibacterota bacterium]
MRLNRYLSVSGYTSRRKGEEIIREGRVAVNGAVVTDPAIHVEPDNALVTVDGVLLVINTEKRYYVMNKPAGAIVSKGDTHARPTVYDILESETKGVFSVGRLDFDTTGVLLFTDDGELAHRLAHPSFGVKKVYCANVKGRVNKSDIQKLKDGVILEDGLTAPSDMVISESSKTGSTVELTIHEGRKRLVRRMLAHIGHPVVTLERISFGGITADAIPPGSYRPLTSKEIKILKKATAMPSAKDK